MTTNPDPDSWLREFLKWWIDDATGLPIKERSGIVRYFVNVEGDGIKWGSMVELKKKYPSLRPRSVTFISANITDNRILMKADPDYLANLQSLPRVERDRLLYGNWNSRHEAGKVFNRSWFDFVDAIPTDVEKRVRAWDKAGSDGKGDYTVGCRISKTKSGLYFIEDVVRGQWSAAERENVIRQVAEMDGHDCEIIIEQEPGSSGKDGAVATVTGLAGYKVKAKTSTGSKITRAEPFASQCEVKNVKIVKAEWNKTFIEELHNFPSGKHDDQVDAASAAFNHIATRKAFYMI